MSPQATPKLRTKDQVRRSVWKAMDREGIARFPGAEGRIPNFAGAKQAAERLATHRLWKRARVIKANPDSPQTHARRLALEQGKTVVMAVPRLRDVHPLRVLDPRKLSKKAIREAATIKGALRHGEVAGPEEIPDIDFVLCGSVAVNLSGARICSVTVEDGSGDIEIRDVGQNVLAYEIGSGTIRVTGVEGNFTARDGRSDRIRHSGVRGVVDIPQRRERRRDRR